MHGPGGEHMRAILLVGLLAATALAGCLSDDEVTADGPEKITKELAAGVTMEAFGNASQAIEEFADIAGTYYSIDASTFEPTIGATSTGGIFMTNFRGLGSGTHIMGSMDQGQTWNDVTPLLPTGMKAVPNSNDPFIFVDQMTDRIYDFDMCIILSGFCVSYSDDDGQTWVTESIATGFAPALDHQSIAAAPSDMATPVYPNALVWCVNRGLTITGAWCSTSVDGGLVWTPLVPGFPATTPQCSGLHGHVTSSSNGNFYRGNPSCNGPAAYRSTDSGFTWTQHEISDVQSLGHEIALAADSESGVYAFWIGREDGLPYFAVSNDHGETWGQAMEVAPDPVTATGFPTIEVLAPGHVAFAYIGTEVEDGYDGEAADMTWNGYIGISTDATPDGATIVTAMVNDRDDPLDTERPCGRIRCGGFGDFIDIAIDFDGRPWAALAHNGQDNAGIVGTLVAGPSLTGEGMLEELPVGGASEWGSEE